MVQQVEAVPHVGKAVRERRRAAYPDAKGKQSSGTFAQLLQDAVEQGTDSSMNCHVTTYGRDCRIRIFDYQPGNCYCYSK